MYAIGTFGRLLSHWFNPPEGSRRGEDGGEHVPDQFRGSKDPLELSVLRAASLAETKGDIVAQKAAREAARKAAQQVREESSPERPRSTDDFSSGQQPPRTVTVGQVATCSQCGSPAAGGSCGYCGSEFAASVKAPLTPQEAFLSDQRPRI